MSRMVEDLILLAQSDEPDFLVLEPVDVEGLTNDVHAKAERLGDRKWRIDALGRGIIVADRQRLTQAMVQLAQNAVQHTEEGAEIGAGFGSHSRRGALLGARHRAGHRAGGP